MKLSIVIVNFNTKDLLNDCLCSLYQTIKGYRYEIFVIDNNSNDGSAAMISQQHPQTRLIENTENLGFAGASNQAIRMGTGEYFLLLNPDTVVCEASIDWLINFMDQNPTVGVSSPKILNTDFTFQHTSCGTFPRLRHVLLWQMIPQIFGKCQTNNPWYQTPPTTMEIDWVSGACMLIRSKVLEEIGLLDERFFSFFEDIDFCYRTRQKHWQVYYCDESQIIHLFTKSWEKLPVKAIRTRIESELAFFAKHHGRIQALVCSLIIIHGSLSRLVIWSLIHLFWRTRGARKITEHKAILKWEIYAIRSYSRGTHST